MSFANPLIYAAPIFILLIIIEFCSSYFYGDKKLYRLQDFKSSLYIGIGTLIIASILKVTIVGASFIFVYNFFNPVVDGIRTNLLGYKSFGFAWYTWIACQFLDDFTFYWYHRLSHTVRILWAIHLPHHSSTNYNLGTAVRIGWFVSFYKPLFYFWLLAIGFHYEMLLLCMGIETIYQFQLHTKYIPRLGFLEYIFVTHTQHQIHHSKYIPHLDKNHGGIFSIFDQIFGTYKEFTKNELVDFGILHPPESGKAIPVITHEFKSIWADVKSANNLKEIWMYTFGPPGWSIDGSRKTSKQLQSEFLTQRL